MEIRTNDLALTPAELEAAKRVGARLKADLVSLYRTSEGLRAYVVDTGGGEHLGVRVAPANA